MLDEAAKIRLANDRASYKRRVNRVNRQAKLKDENIKSQILENTKKRKKTLDLNGPQFNTINAMFSKIKEEK